MLYLLLAVCCSLAIGMIFKHAGRYRLDRTALLTANYAAAVVLAGVLLMLGEREVANGLTANGGLAALGVVTGALLITGFFVLSLATEVAGMSLAIGVMRVSVVIPFLASWIVWEEIPTTWQIAGMVLAAVAFFLIARVDPAKEQSVEFGTSAREAWPPEAIHQSASGHLPPFRVFSVLVALFLVGGAVDVSVKAFQEGYGAGNSRVLFLLLAFGVAFLLGLAVVLWRGWQRGQWPTVATLGWGGLLGIVNYGSIEFILRALEQLPGTFVFPVNNIAIVLLAAVLGVVVWGEWLSRTNRLGLAVAVMALLLLNT